MKFLVLVLWLGVSFLIDKSFQVECKYCFKDFLHVGKHEWRCKARVNRDETHVNLPIADENINVRGTASNVVTENVVNVNDPLVNSRDNSLDQSHDPSNDNCQHSHQCYCGRYFKSLRGLNTHRRSCFVTEQPFLNDLLVIREPLENVETIDETVNDSTEIIPKVVIKQGLKLPKSTRDWEIANNYFKLHLNYTTTINDVDCEIRHFNDVVYNYFKENHGINSTSGDNTEFSAKYESMSKSQLKNCLRKLKESGNEVPHSLEEIKYVSQLLRQKLKSKSTAKIFDFDHNARIKENYWGYCKQIFDKDEIVQPDFDEDTCYRYFRDILREKNPSRSFTLPSWMKTLQEPTVDFNLSTPSYKEVHKIISRMKSSGSPCPIDHISVLVLKNCPILRTQIWRFCIYCWEHKYFPSEWKNGATILIYKKGSASDPSNFRPITLEPVLSKVLTSLIRNRIFTFVLQNKFIESNIQKGFWTGVSGTIEHTELLTHIINHSKLKQKQLVVTLFDLKNAFGEVNHNLIRKVLKFHHVPDAVGELILSQYSNYYVSIFTKTYNTHPINVQRGVLQGDCLSPLIFNLCVNTLVETVKCAEVNCLGYVFADGLSPRHWFQFADDTAIVSALEEDNQYLCNAFSKWATWADLKIRADKCHTFGIKKSSTSSVQYNPMILVNGERIAPTKPGESFIYLGKQFNFGMDIQNIKDELIADNLKYITTIDQLPLTSLNKISIIQQYVFSKYRWLFSIYDLTETWIAENIDNVIGKYLRKWFQLPVCANIVHLSFPTRNLGVSFTFAKTVYIRCKLSVRRILKLSKNVEIRKLYDIFSSKNVRSDCIINSIIQSNPELNKKQINSKVDQAFSKSQQKESWNDFMKLSEQNVIVKHITTVCQPKLISMWQYLMKQLPNNIFCFTRKALIFCLPNKSNLFRWKIKDDNKCQMCQKPETQLHVFSNCTSYLNRYTWRHDSVLKTIANKVSRHQCENVKIFVDLENVPFPCTSEVFSNSRPDLVVKLDNKIFAVELTICFDTNTHKSRNYKQTRYSNLRSQLLIDCDDFEIIFIEFTTLGFISKDSLLQFSKLLKALNVYQDRTIIKCMETAIRATYYIFCRRNNVWTDPELLNFY